MLARVGEEKANAVARRSGSLHPVDIDRRVRSSLDLYEDLLPLRLGRLVVQLGSEEAARERLRLEAGHRAQQEEEALMRIQARVYGSHR
jgi:hypothetical protein